MCWDFGTASLQGWSKSRSEVVPAQAQGRKHNTNPWCGTLHRRYSSGTHLNQSIRSVSLRSEASRKAMLRRGTGA
jgi:hypothetical protein